MSSQVWPDEDLKYFENLLIEKRAKLLEELDYLDHTTHQNQKDMGADTSYGNHMADGASDSFNLETNFDLAQREGKYLVYIEEALGRIKNKSYGVCKTCKELIPKARLEAVPTATSCVACKEASKKKEKIS